MEILVGWGGASTGPRLTPLVCNTSALASHVETTIADKPMDLARVNTSLSNTSLSFSIVSVVLLCVVSYASQVVC
jgi:hypothetical protein